MNKLGSDGQKWLKSVHLLSAGLWVGGGCALALRQFFVSPSDGSELYGILSTMNFIDLFIIIPGAMGCLVTGILYSSLTPWGWFRHRWITVKWIICLYGVVFGTYPLGPWLGEMVSIAGREGMGAFSDTTFLFNRQMSMVFGTFQAATIILTFFISVFKPWKKRK